MEPELKAAVEKPEDIIDFSKITTKKKTTLKNNDIEVANCIHHIFSE